MNALARKTLKIVGKPGLMITVQQRGSQDIEAFGEQEVLFAGRLDQNGEATMYVPRGAILVLLGDRAGGTMRIEIGRDEALETVNI